ncbi:MAG: hypothetical protein U0031_16560 [Thermomicrobiales bacterium]
MSGGTPRWSPLSLAVPILLPAEVVPDQDVQLATAEGPRGARAGRHRRMPWCGKEDSVSAVVANIIPKEDVVRDVLTIVELGEAAGVVYVSDALIADVLSPKGRAVLADSGFALVNPPRS